MMMKSLLVEFVFVAQVASKVLKCSRDPLVNRIVGGEIAKPGEFPFIVNTQLKSEGIGSGYTSCGGSIYNEKTIITAGHCVTDKSGLSDDGKYILTKRNISNMVVVAGDYDKAENETEQVAEIEDVIVHEEYYPYRNDIALIILKTRLRFNKRIHPIMLGSKELTERSPRAVVIGWGQRISKNVYDGYESSCILKKATLPLFPESYCRKVPGMSLPELDPDFEKVICMGEHGQAECRGDSGGPIVVTDEDGCMKLIGAVSYSIKPCGAKAPGFETNVAHFTDWIEKNAAAGYEKGECGKVYPDV